jgi:hypothetical protein
MSVEILNNPTFQMAVRHEESKAGLRDQLANLLMTTKTWETMNEKERKLCVQSVVSQVSSELELSRRLNDIGLTDCAINWSDVDPNEKTALEAQMIVKALGGLVAKNGALVSIMTVEDMF